MQKERAIATGVVKLSAAKRNKLEDVMSVMSKSVRITEKRFIGTDRNSDVLTFKFEYGPVWGCWEDDVRKKVLQACVKAGTSPNFAVTKFERSIVERR
jgi:hypothetical protein